MSVQQQASDIQAEKCVQGRTEALAKPRTSKDLQLEQPRALTNGAQDEAKEDRAASAAAAAAGSESSSAVLLGTSASANPAHAGRGVALSGAAACNAKRACWVPRSRLRVTLERLRATLQAMPPDVRQASILGLDARVRVALLEFMEVRAISTRQEEKKSSLQAAGQACRRAPVKKLEKARGKAKAMMAKAGEARVHRGSRGLYRAKLCIDGITLYGPYSSREAAETQQRTLAELRALVMKQLATPCEQRREAPFRSSFVRAVEELAQKDISLQEAGIHVYLSLHVARWLGSVHVTSPVVSVEEALLLREGLLQARREGWEAFRRAWLNLLCHQERQRLRPGRKRFLWEDAEQHVDGAYRRNAAKRAASRSLLDLRPANLRAVGAPPQQRQTHTHRLRSLRPRKDSQFRAKQLERRLVSSVSAVRRALDPFARHVTQKTRTSRVNQNLQGPKYKRPGSF